MPDENVEYPWFAIMVIILLIALPAIFIPLVWIYRAIRVKCFDQEEFDGILANKKWKHFFKDIAFWKKKYC